MLISLVIFKKPLDTPKAEPEFDDNILAKEIESWKGFEYALRQQHAKPFNLMLKECLENEEFAAASKSQGPQRSTESMFMALIFQQQKMISKLIKQIESKLEQREK